LSIEFVITSLTVVASPGIGVLYTLAAGLARGSRASIVAAFACTLGIVPHMVAAILGLAAVLHTSALLFQALKYAGVAYLLFMAWQMLRGGGALSIQPETASRSALEIVATGILINLLNPKLSIFFLAFLPQFISVHDAHPLARMVELSLAFMAMTFAIFVVYGLAAAAVRDHVIARPQVMSWMRRAFAGGFAAMGVRLALSER
jgi:threonine/homoserine/homoserine lactone efflux protein